MSKEKKRFVQKEKIITLVLGLIALILTGLIFLDFLEEEPAQDWVQEEVDAEKNEMSLDEEVEEVFTYWELPEDKEGYNIHSLTLGFSNTNKVEAEIKYGSFYLGHYRYFLTVKEDKEISDDYKKYYYIDKVEKVEYDLANSSYPFEREDLNDYLDSQDLEYDIERFAKRVCYTIYEPDLDNLEIGAIPDYPYEYILQKIDYAADDNDFFEDYLLFMEEYQLFPVE